MLLCFLWFLSRNACMSLFSYKNMTDIHSLEWNCFSWQPLNFRLCPTLNPYVTLSLLLFFSFFFFPPNASKLLNVGQSPLFDTFTSHAYFASQNDLFLTLKISSSYSSKLGPWPKTAFCLASHYQCCLLLPSALVVINQRQIFTLHVSYHMELPNYTIYKLCFALHPNMDTWFQLKMFKS